MIWTHSVQKVLVAGAEILEKHGTRDLNKLYRAEGLTLYECSDFRDLKGMYAKVGERYCVFVKEDLDIVMKPHVLAHELGHHYLHRDLLDSLKILQDQSFVDMSSQLEIEANLFAAELLLMDDVFLDLARQENSIDQIAGALSVLPELVELKALLLQHKGVPLRLPELPSGNFLLRI